jgi:hypothetical protein
MRNTDENVLLQRRMEFINTEPDTDSERLLASSPSGRQPTSIKAEEDPVLMIFPVVRSESEVSCVFLVQLLSQNSNNYLRHCHLQVSSVCNIFLVE